MSTSVEDPSGNTFQVFVTSGDLVLMPSLRAYLTDASDNASVFSFPIAAALDDAIANPTVAPDASCLLVFNSDHWERLTGDATNGVDVDVTRSALPTGASTAAKQPALGTAGTASSDVLTVQGIASMTPLLVNGSGVTQPISAASLPLPTGAATATNQSTANGHLATLAGVDYATQTTLATLLAESTFTGRVGEVQTTPTANTILGRLKALETALAGTLAVSAASLPLPSGAATSSNQTTANGHLATIAGGIISTADLDTGGGTDTKSAVGLLLAESGGAVEVGSANPMPIAGSVTANAGTNLNTSALLTESTFTGRIGEVQTTPTANTVLGRLKDLITGIVLAAGSNVIGFVNLITGQTGITGGAGAVAANTPRVTHASDDPAVALLTAIDSDTGSILSVINSVALATFVGPYRKEDVAGGSGSYSIVGNAAILKWIEISNLDNDEDVYLHIFDIASPTMGTDGTNLLLAVPARGIRSELFSSGLPFATAISYGVATTANGTTAPSNNVIVNAVVYSTGP